MIILRSHYSREPKKRQDTTNTPHIGARKEPYPCYDNTKKTGQETLRPNTEISSYLVVNCRHQIRKEKYQGERKMETPPPLCETLVAEIRQEVKREREREKRFVRVRTKAGQA